MRNGHIRFHIQRRFPELLGREASSEELDDLTARASREVMEVIHGNPGENFNFRQAWIFSVRESIDSWIREAGDDRSPQPAEQ